MLFNNALPIPLGILLAALAPILVTPVAPNAVHISGTVPGAPALQTVLYATFAPELPRVLLSRQPLATDAGGHFDTTVSIAPAYFNGAIVTVIVQTSAGAIVGQGHLVIADPTGTAPDRN